MEIMYVVYNANDSLNSINVYFFFVTKSCIFMHCLLILIYNNMK